MARTDRTHPKNAPGDFYVDTTCIDCDTCRWMAPETFRCEDGQSVVSRQPAGEDENRSAFLALTACPTGSIGVRQKSPLLAGAAAAFPIAVEEPVYHCGFHAWNSFAATSYFIRREDGNVLVDSPRFAGPLIKKLEAWGGVRYHYLTHRDDVGDHERFREKFGCERIMGKGDLGWGIEKVEIPLEGDEPFVLAQDLRIIPTPGHTAGHTVLLFDHKFLFTGDHLAYSPRRGHLYGFKDYCDDWATQKRSMARLKDLSIEWVLPGHGRRFHGSRDEMKAQLEKCLDWMDRS